jgi:anti-sigma B factor antagonist
MMPGGWLTLAVSVEDGITFARILPERVEDAATAERLGEELLALAQPALARVAVDFAGVTFLSSATLGRLITAQRFARLQQGRMVFFSLAPDVAQLMRVSRLDTYFDLLDDADGARAALLGV